jgi:hypothetical protein
MKTIISVFILALAIPVQAKTYPKPISWIFLRSVPIILENIVTVTIPAFWSAMAAAGAVDVLDEMTQPVDDYEAGIKHVTGSTSAEMSWVDGEYPTRQLEAERVYDYDPYTKTETWWIKSIFSEELSDGTMSTTTTYSQQPPLLKDFRMEDIHYKRFGLSGAHQTSFSYDAYETVTCYCIRRGSSAWGRPVVAFTTGFYFDATFRDDIKYEVPTSGYEDRHYCFIGPGSMSQWKPRWDDDTNIEIFQTGVVTLLLKPD